MEGHFLEHEEIGPPLTQLSVEQARYLGIQLRADEEEFDFSMVAISEMLRTEQTARALGAKATRVYPILNEVLLTDEEKQMLLRNKIPLSVFERGAEILDDPPEEQVVVSHGGPIAGLCAVLGVQVERFLPVHLETRILDF